MSGGGGLAHRWPTREREDDSASSREGDRRCTVKGGPQCCPGASLRYANISAPTSPHLLQPPRRAGLVPLPHRRHCCVVGGGNGSAAGTGGYRF